MKSTNYYIIHKATGRKIKVMLFGYCHTPAQREAMVAGFAKVERHRADQYRVKLEKEIEGLQPERTINLWDWRGIAGPRSNGVIYR